MIVELEIFFQILFCIIAAVVVININLFIFGAAPESFNKDLVTSAAIRTHSG
jgi:hypothetical protein